MRTFLSLLTVLWFFVLSTIIFPFPAPKADPKAPLICFAEDSLKTVMQTLAQKYEEDKGIKIELDSLPSEQAIIKIKQTGRGDLLIVTETFIEPLKNEKMIAEKWPIGSFYVVQLSTALRPDAVNKFCKFIVSEEGLAIWQMHGFVVLKKEE